MTWLLGEVNYYSEKTAAPAVTDDLNKGYVVSDIWIDETNDVAYQCLDTTAGAAVWHRLTMLPSEWDDLTDGGDTLLHIHDSRYYTETELSSTGTGHTSGSDLIGIPIIAGATNTSLHELANAFSSAGRYTGGAISDAGGETVNVTAGTGWIKATDDDTAELLSFDWGVSNGLAIPTDTTRFIGVVYGSPPVVDVRIGNDYDLDTEFILGSVVNEGGTLHILNNPWWVTDGLTNVLERFRGEGHLVRDNHIGGLTLSVTATRRINVSAGTLWSLLNEFPFSAFTSVADAATFEAYYVDSLGVWRDADLYQYLVTSWNDKSQSGTAALAALGNNKYLNLWVYVEADDDEVAIIYGDTQYVSAAGAEAQAPPSSFPNHIVEHGILIGRIIIKQGVDAPIQVDTVWTTTFTASQAAIHSNLANLAWSVSGHTIDSDIAMGTNKLTGLKVPNTAGDSIRATAKITEVALESAIDNDHAIYVHPNHSGEVTSVADGATTIANDAVTYAKMQNISATNKGLGRVTAGAGDVEEFDLTAAGRALLDDATAAAQATTLGLGTGDSPTFVTAKLSGLTDLKIPKHVSDATGLADTTITVSADNEVTNTSQPLFVVTSNLQSNVTGNGTDYDPCLWANEAVDQGANFASNVFTAPITGTYLLTTTLALQGLAAAQVCYIEITTSNQIYGYTTKAIGAGNQTINVTVVADMDATDTASIRLICYGVSPDAVDIAAGSSFAGYLVC